MQLHYYVAAGRGMGWADVWPLCPAWTRMASWVHAGRFGWEGHGRARANQKSVFVL